MEFRADVPGLTATLHVDLAADAPLEALEFLGALAAVFRAHQAQSARVDPPAPQEPAIRPAAPRRPGRASTVDWPKVRDVAQRARREGRSVPSALAVEFRVPMTTAKNWAQRCRREGWLDEGRVHVDTSSEPAPEVVPEPTPAAELIERAAWLPAPDDEALRSAAELITAAELGPELHVVPDPVDDVVDDDEPIDDDPPEPIEDWAEVADVYLDAVTKGLRPLAALARYFDVERHHVVMWPAECRRRGLLPPADEPQIPADLSDVRAARPRYGSTM